MSLKRALVGLGVAPVLVVAGCGGSSGRGTNEPAASKPAASPAADASATVRLRTVGNFDAPTYLTSPPGDRKRRFVVERSGRIILLKGRHRVRRAFLNIQSRVSTGGEEGLLSMAFAPDYKTSRRYYVFFIAHDHSIHIEEYRRSKPNPDRTAKGSGRLVLRQAHHESNHKGGQLQFGKDGMLYAGFGDGGSEGDPNRNGQKLSTLLAKLIRIDPLPSGGRSYGIPKSNPFVGRGGRDEIYAYGLRNPYRFSFDRRTGDLTIGDVGQDKYEEVDFVRNRRGKGHAPPGGYNFGWSAFEARHHYNSGSAPGHRAPVLERSHDAGFCSIIGGYVIRDRSLGKKLYGRYVYGDLCDPHLRLARLRPGKARGDHSLGPKVNNLVSFGEDGRGHVYAMSLSGKVYRLAR